MNITEKILAKFGYYKIPKTTPETLNPYNLIVLTSDTIEMLIQKSEIPYKGKPDEGRKNDIFLRQKYEGLEINQDSVFKPIYIDPLENIKLFRQMGLKNQKTK